MPQTRQRRLPRPKRQPRRQAQPRRQGGQCDRRKALVAAVRRLAGRRGRTPTVRQFCQFSGIGTTTIYRYFTSWEDVCAAAGLQATTARNRSRAERRRDLVEAVREMAASHGPNLTLRTFCQQRNIPESRVYWDFASWRQLRVAAGLPPHIDRSAASVIHTRQSLLAALRPLVAELGPMVTLAAFRLRTGISDSPIARVFGSWRAMREAAGLPARVRPEPDPRHSHDALVELLRKIGHERPYITKREFCEENEIPMMTVDRVGPWSELRRKAYLPGNGSRAEAHNYEVTKDLIMHPQLWHEMLIAPLEVPVDERRAACLSRRGEASLRRESGDSVGDAARGSPD